MNPQGKRVSTKITELVGHGVTSVSEMKRHLRIYVEKELFTSEATRPALNNVAYYPTDVIVRKHIYMAQVQLRCSIEYMPTYKHTQHVLSIPVRNIASLLNVYTHIVKDNKNAHPTPWGGGGQHKNTMCHVVYD